MNGIEKENGLPSGSAVPHCDKSSVFVKPLVVDPPERRHFTRTPDVTVLRKRAQLNSASSAVSQQCRSAHTDVGFASRTGSAPCSNVSHFSSPGLRSLPGREHADLSSPFYNPFEDPSDVEALAQCTFSPSVFATVVSPSDCVVSLILCYLVISFC